MSPNMAILSLVTKNVASDMGVLSLLLCSALLYFSPLIPSFFSVSFHFSSIPSFPFTFVDFSYALKQPVSELKEKVDPFLRFSGLNNLSDK